MKFVETAVFTRLVKSALPDDDYRLLQTVLLLRPEQGALIPGTGGLRKIRWGGKGHRKRGGYRVIYYLDRNSEAFYMLTGTEGVQMNNKDYAKLTESIKQAGKIRRGKMKAARTTTYHAADVRAIRNKLGKSQSEFALLIGVSIATLQNWEQGRRRPEGPAQALLRIADRNPRAVADALGA